MADVEFRNFIKRYGDTLVIKNMSLKVKDGEFLVLVGPSGCGKSTMLRSVAGLETVSGGEIKIGGEVVNHRPPKDRNIAMVFQSYALYPHMTVKENMGFGLKVRKFKPEEIDKRIKNAAELLDITHLLNRLPREMSGGQRQRVAMGRAIVRNPDVFLFDEPLSNLDAALRTQMRAELKQLHERLGTTVIYVTHDQVEAMTLADRIVLLYNGVVQQLGTPSELFDAPANKFTASFIGSPSMNFFHGEVLRENGEKNFISPGVSVPLSLPENYEKREIILGVRPQDFKIAKKENSHISGKVKIAENLGRYSILSIVLENGNIVKFQLSSEHTREMKRKETVYFSIKQDKMHIFDAETEKRMEFNDK